MFRKYGLPLLAVLGITFAVWRVMQGSKPVVPAQPVAQPSQAPFPSYIAGAGIVEAKTDNIAIGAPVSGLVMKVSVEVGGKVNKGDPLFKLDDRNQQAELAVRRTALYTTQERLNRLIGLPRPEDLPPAEARVKETEASLADAKSQLALVESITDKRAISVEEVNRRWYAVQSAEAKLAESQTQLAQLKAGVWKPDIEIAKAEAAAAQAQVKAMETEIERLTVRSPITGEILQVNIRVGEYAQAGVLATPLMLIGNLDRLNVRTDIDENDAWRFRTDAPAIAYIRGNPDLHVNLTFEYVEPYVVPKRSLTGDSIERVDTRVLQVLYSFDRHSLPVYVGQLMDIFIEAPSVSAASNSLLNSKDGSNKEEGGNVK